MATIKTAISIDERLFRAMERMAKKTRVSRSRLFSQAAEHFLRRGIGANLTEQINRAYSIPESVEEKRTRQALARNARRVIKDTW